MRGGRLRITVPSLASTVEAGGPVAKETASNESPTSTVSLGVRGVAVLMVTPEITVPLADPTSSIVTPDCEIRMRA